MTDLSEQRDDGPLARALAPLGRRLPASGLAALAVLVPLGALALTGARGSTALLAATVGWMVLFGGASRGAGPAGDRFGWTVPALLRAGEYAVLLWISSAGCAEGPAAGFALLVVLAFHHYDLVYRPAYQGRPPARWASALGGGWDGRLVVAWALLAAGALPAGLYVTAAVLGVVYVCESAASWRAPGAQDGAR